jgi:hypothetical protein
MHKKVSANKTIAFVISSLNLGGEQRVLSILVNKLCRVGYNIKIIVLNRLEESYYEIDDMIEILSIERKRFNNIFRLMMLCEYVKKYNISILIGFSIIPSILCCISSIFCKTKVIVCERSNPARYSLKYKILRRIAYKRANGFVFQTNNARNYFKKYKIKKYKIIGKPMHMQPIYRTNPFVTVEGNGRGRTNAYIKGSGIDVGADIFRRGLCLPSDNKMTPEQQDKVIEIIHRCFQ